MPPEVLVLCSLCRRPNPAVRGTCAFCNARLPEAPLPGRALSARSFEAPLGGGRHLSSREGALTFQASARAAPQAVALEALTGAVLVRRPTYEALAPAAAALVAALLVDGVAARGVLLVLALLLGALALLFRLHALQLTLGEGRRHQWRLGTAGRGSARERQLAATWVTLAEALRARGLPVEERTGL
ncbi:hypothetical protein FGE12_28275 [Aggregicoccus sp. 17bor-14]|uniref:hypothetical protein n=1 Tax=Myxococcaceae TaxID=31 RepID=UPI00129C61AC|nr:MULTISPECIES: hypothetical protein [Myxococcaceae]MBF5046346.1 hypothetical protein [Simulacricoccus sp. 17bor-14]MRI92066.1 hypothetical protein [Aggregicoccus sp. 17bor-14]